MVFILLLKKSGKKQKDELNDENAKLPPVASVPSVKKSLTDNTDEHR